MDAVSILNRKGNFTHITFRISVTAIAKLLCHHALFTVQWENANYSLS